MPKYNMFNDSEVHEFLGTFDEKDYWEYCCTIIPVSGNSRPEESRHIRYIEDSSRNMHQGFRDALDALNARDDLKPYFVLFSRDSTRYVIATNMERILAKDDEHAIAKGRKVVESHVNAAAYGPQKIHMIHDNGYNVIYKGE